MPCICQRCKGTGILEAQLRNLETCDYEWHIIVCDNCMGKGIRVHEPDRVYASTSYRREQPYGSMTPAAKACQQPSV